MKIKRIEIIGFKSFVDKTVLNFEPGITAILGPNGCGKSNVVDAIRWAMGEQNAKNLRGQSMEDVIFGGSEKRRAHGMAEVTMVFSNPQGVGTTILSQYSEIMVTRRLYRNGDSEYLLNKTPCRLKDISELFMDTGVGARAYSIIEQGKIGQILHSRPEERRVLIEEAAGVTKYKARKKAALRKIESTRQNLTRLNDVIGEVRRQRDSLRRQAGKAQRFRELRTQARELELFLARCQWLELELQNEQVHGQLKEAGATQLVLENAVADSELRFEQARIKQIELDEAAGQVQSQLFHLASDIQKVESELELARQQQQHLQQQQQQLNAEIDQSDRSSQAAGGNIDELQCCCRDAVQRLTQLGQQKEQTSEQVKQLVQREQEQASRLEEVRKQLLACHGRISMAQERRAQADQKLSLLEERKRRQVVERMSLEEQREQHQQQLSDFREESSQQDELVLQGRQLLGELQQQRQQALTQRQATQKTVQELQRSFHRCTSRLESLQELDAGRAGYVDGVKQALALPQLASGGHGVVADALRVAPEDERAVAAALGTRLQAVQLDPSALLQYLADPQGLSRCSFQLPNVVAPVILSGATPLLERVAVAPEAEPYIGNIFNGLYLVDSLSPYCTRSLPAGTCLVTPQGDLLYWHGQVVLGQAQDQDQGQRLLESKRQIDELQQQSVELERQLRCAEQLLVGQDEEFDRLSQQVQEQNLVVQRNQLRLDELAKDCSRLLRELERIEERCETLAYDADQFAEEESVLQTLSAEAAQLLEQEAGSQQQLQAQLPEREQQLAHAQQHVQQLQAELTQIEVDLARQVERERSLRQDLEREEKATEERQQLQGQRRIRLEQCDTELIALLDHQASCQTRLQVLMARREREVEVQKQKADQLQVVLQQVGDCEQQAKQNRRDLSAANERHAALQLKAREQRLELQHLHQTMREKYQVDLEQTVDVDVRDVPQATERLHRLRVRLEAFGEVNLMAIDEFTALEERYTFLEQQREDVNASIDDLQAAITRINRTTRKRFKEAFELVNEQFKRVFPRLFVGGEAELRLTDEADLLESGIEIIAQPPGKKLQNVGLLSGGEKALTAVALIFAIFLIKPSPFCVLDEVDAPLDDANIGRFNEMVKEMSRASQFVVITHNTRTMEIADTLFGVTMEDPGVSSLVAVRMDELTGTSVET